jgi:hypothetical protein
LPARFDDDRLIGLDHQGRAGNAIADLQLLAGVDGSVVPGAV